MLTYKRLLVFVYVFTFFTGKARETSSVNPLLVHSNQGVPFDKVNASTIRQAVTTVIKLSDERVKRITSVPGKDRTQSNTLMAFDELNYDLADLSMKLGLIAATFTDDNTRDAANDLGFVNK